MELKETHTNEPREVRHGSTGRQEAEVKKKKKIKNSRLAWATE